MGAESGNSSLPLYLLWNTSGHKYYGAKVNQLSSTDLEDFRKHIKANLYSRIRENEKSNFISVLSAEELSHESMTNNCIKQILADLQRLSRKIQVVALARSIPDFIGSLLQQKIKGGGRNVQMSVEEIPALFSPRLAHWKEATLEYDIPFCIELIDKLKTTEVKLEEHFLRLMCSNTLSSQIVNDLCYKKIAANSRLDLGRLKILAKVNELIRHFDPASKYKVLQHAKRELTKRPERFNGFSRVPYRPSLLENVSLMCKITDEAKFLSQLSQNHSRYPFEMQDVMGQAVPNSSIDDNLIPEKVIISQANLLVSEALGECSNQ